MNFFLNIKLLLLDEKPDFQQFLTLDGNLIIEHVCEAIQLMRSNQV